jgi:Tol biopolymer transport system component
MKADGSAAARNTFCGPSYYCIAPKWSPVLGDNRILYYQGTYSSSGATPISAIRVRTADGSYTTTLWSDPLVAGSPVWSPDAQRVAFLGRLHGQSSPDIYTLVASGGPPSQLTHTVGVVAGAPAWAR